jgi:hypothetical protein
MEHKAINWLAGNGKGGAASIACDCADADVFAVSAGTDVLSG